MAFLLAGINNIFRIAPPSPEKFSCYALGDNIERRPYSITGILLLYDFRKRTGTKTLNKNNPSCLQKTFIIKIKI